ncbi:hypothetical protein PLEOSDRAFT_1045027 [Pleurotus ostreatus PC15]|uniref:Tetraspanin Tsp2 family n=1 Tax=Pleurotus ostreatus (strain PC15) TaxID=1137138 RepID=A0A067NDA9_PLEO1|nr:hypothetical protein PLEOSDRAFT_1045027 [Pleurotus ostreatus PC15]
MDYRKPQAASRNGRPLDNTFRRRSGRHPPSGTFIAGGHSTDDGPSCYERPLQGNGPALGDTFTSIHLTPRLPTREHSHSSMFSDVTRVSQIVRLPTPDFTTGPNLRSVTGTFRSYLSRGLSFVSIPAQPPAGFLSRQSSASSAYSRSTVCIDDHEQKSTSASGEGNSLIRDIGTTSKFTNKWPCPKSVSTSTIDLHPKLFSFELTKEKDLPSTLKQANGLGIETLGRWNKFKWALILSVLLLLSYSCVLATASISTWFRTWNLSDVIYVADNDILVLATIAAAILLFTFILGFTGVILNSRPILAVYTLLLWPSLVSILVIGYTSYKRSAFSLDRKLQRAWSQDYTEVGRVMIQNSLQCCGWFNALHQATMSNRCYPRTSLPGCKSALLSFEKAHLETIWKIIFGLIIPAHILNIFVALLCSNHVTETFGKGITPKGYRLTADDVKRDKDELMEKYGIGRASVLARPTYARAGCSRGVHREDRE